MKYISKISLVLLLFTGCINAGNIDQCNQFKDQKMCEAAKFKKYSCKFENKKCISYCGYTKQATCLPWLNCSYGKNKSYKNTDTDQSENCSIKFN